MFRFIPFYVALILFVALTGLYLTKRLGHILPGKWRYVIWPFIMAMFTAPIIFRTSFDTQITSSMRFFMWFGFSLMGIFSFLLVFSLKAHLIEFLTIRFNKKIRYDQNRRMFISKAFQSGAILMATPPTIVGFMKGRARPIIKEVPIQFKFLPADWKDLTIVQLSDIHIGPTIDGEWLEEVVSLANQTTPDLFVITGDLVDGSVEQLKQHIAPLKKLRSKFGTYFVTGNHEAYSGIEEWTKHLTQMGIQILSNNHLVLNNNGIDWVLGGVPDIRTSPVPSSPSQSLQNSPALAAIKILLAHQPKSCEEAQKAGYHLQLSGHTHAGQFYPWTFLVKIVHPYAQGLNYHNGMAIYVNPGTGYWGPPFRSGLPSEISKIVIQRSVNS